MLELRCNTHGPVCAPACGTQRVRDTHLSERRQERKWSDSDKSNPLNRFRLIDYNRSI
jgi:hypothetical protein